jgi:hypothetical protein
LNKYQVKKGLEVAYKRVDKHYSEEEGLLQVVWRGIQEEFCRHVRKYEELISKCYPDITVRLEFSMVIRRLISARTFRILFGSGSESLKYKFNSSFFITFDQYLKVLLT